MTPSGLPETTSTTRPSTSLEKLYSHFVPGWKSSGALPRRAMNSSDVISRDAALDEVGYAWWISVVPRLPYVRPEVCRSRSWIVISRSAGPSASTLLPVIGSMRSTPTCILPSAGMYLEIGSLTNSRPSS